MRLSKRTPSCFNTQFGLLGKYSACKEKPLKYAVEVKGLRKTFVSGLFRKRRKEASKDLDLRVPDGTIWGILGLTKSNMDTKKL